MANQMTCNGWFIVAETSFVSRNNHGHRVIKSWKAAKGIPSNAEQYDSEHEAQQEIEAMQRMGYWPLISFKPEFRAWA